MSNIAGRHGVTVDDLQKWNSLRSNRIREGNALVIHVPPGHEPSSTPSQGAPSQNASSQDASSSRPQVHVLRRGETIGILARRYNLTVKSIMDLNGIEDPTRLIAGQRIKIPE